MMYAVIEYNSYQEQQFEVITTTEDLVFAKRLAFQNAKKNLPTDKTDPEIYKITTRTEDTHLTILNKKIISYQIVCLEQNKKEYHLSYYFSIVYSVVELEDSDISYPIEIDTSLLCDNYLGEYFSETDTDTD